MKKIVWTVGLVLLACIAICSVAAAEGAEGELIFYGDYAYRVRGGQATIEASRGGSIPDWDYEESGHHDRLGQLDNSAVFRNFFDEVWRTVVPSSLGGYPVTAIGRYGMAENYSQDIILPDGLTSIGRRAFAMCEYTLAITVPESVTFIGEYAFNDQCNATLRVARGSYAAEYAEENGIPYTYDQNYKVFESEPWLYSVSDDGATIRGYSMADDDHYAYYKAYSELEDYDPGADAESPIDIEIPAQLGGKPVVALKFHGDPYSFSGSYPSWTANTTIYGSVTIPDTVTKIEGTLLSGIFFFNIIVSPDHPVYESIDGVLFDKAAKTLVVYPGTRSGAYAVPEGTERIGDGAFWGCKRITDVTLPSGLTEIGKEAFYGCVGLTDVNIPVGVTSIEDSAFALCENLSSVILPDGLTNIGEYAFSWCKFSSIDIPDSVASIGHEAFRSCRKLTSVTIPSGIREIEGNPFEYCKIEEVIMPSGNSFYEVVDGVLFDMQHKKLVAYPDGRIGDYMIPEGTEGIGKFAFFACEGLTDVKIPNSVTHIGDSAFESCGGFTRVSIPDSVKRIGKEAFSFCTVLADVIIPNSITSIPDRAFAACDGLTQVTIPSSVASIGDEAFYDCDRLSSIVIPSSVTSIGEAAFAYISESAVFFVEKGSYAEQYAKEEGMDFTYIP